MTQVTFAFALADIAPGTVGPARTSEADLISVRNTSDRTIPNDASIEIEDGVLLGYSDPQARDAYNKLRKALMLDQKEQQKHYPENPAPITGRLVVNGLPDSEVALGSVSLVAGDHELKVELNRLTHQITRVYLHSHHSGHQVCGQEVDKVHVEITGSRAFTIHAHVRSNVLRVDYVALTI